MNEGADVDGPINLVVMCVAPHVVKIVAIVYHDRERFSEAIVVSIGTDINAPEGGTVADVKVTDGTFDTLVWLLDPG